jgi:hypothetical protein
MSWPDAQHVLVQAPKGAGVGLRIPPRESDCSGVRPSWWPFQINVCDHCDDAPDPIAYSGRHLRLPPASSTPYPTLDPCA